MRVTGKMQSIQLLNNLRQTNDNMLQWQNKLSTGKRIQRPGDDPVGIGYLLRYNSDIERGAEFLENANAGYNMLSTMDSVMQQANDVFKRAKVLAQQAGSGTIPADARKTIAAEIKQLKEQLVDIGNSDYGGRYLFNGQKTDQPPYQPATAALDTTDKGVYQLNVSPSVSVPVSISGETIFGAGGSPDNAFKIMDDLYDHLINNDQPALIHDMNRIDAASDLLSGSWAEIGARMNRFDLVKNRIETQIDNITKLRMEVNDVDMAEAITQIKLQENVLQAALSTGARIMQISLIDFMK